MRRLLATLTLALCATAASAQNLTVNPTTSYSTEVGNNTSSAPTFTTQVNGNIGGANISKVDTHTLIYPGFSGKIYAHVEPWWGSSSHINIGYSSQDPAQVQRQISDMASRGIDGAVVDWYGPGSYEDGTVKTFFSQAELNPRFSTIVEIDVGAINWHSCYPTCNATTAVINLFTTMGNTFFSSPAYARNNAGRPVAMEFGMETLSLPSGEPSGWNVVDWNAVQTQVPGNMALFHRNLGGFTKAQSAGAFGWMEPKTLDVEPANYDGTDELIWFYGQSYTTNAARSFGAVWKGFNDILADWAPPGGRHIEQNCGQTWLNTFAVLNQYYSSSNQIAALQLVTWNDYEEGSELESGIDNCVAVTASTSGTKLNWTISGSESTIDHYTVFISIDGTNLMPLGDFGVGSRTVDVSSYSPAAGTYTLYVKAIGKPSLTNKMSNAATLTIATSGTASSLAVTPMTGNAPLAVTATVTSSTTGTVSGGSSTSTTINFGDGTTVTGSTATHTYATPGSYTVSATGTSTMTVTAKAVPPVAALTLSAASATAPATITASTAASTDPNQGGSISGSVIDWGDGTTSAGPNASHSYTTGGTFTVTATVTDNYGASSKATQSLSIAGTPTGVTIASPVNGSTVTGPQVHVAASASSPNGVASMILYVDYSQVGPVVNGANLDTYVPLAPGSHLIAVNSWDKIGNLIQSTTSTVMVAAVTPTTTLSLSATNVTAPATITASATSTDANVGGSISSVVINWGDGSSSAGASASHTYSTAGTYTVTATATDNYGKSSSASQAVSVQAAVAVAPTASMTVMMNGPTATVVSTSTANSGTITSTVINWGDGTSTTGTNASHTYAKGGYDTITLTVTNSYGKTASNSQQVTAAGVVIWLPQPGATAAQPVHIAATAYDSKPIASMIVYLDGTQIYLGYVNDLDLWQSMRSGQHTIVVKAWEAGTGVVYQSSVKFKGQ